MREEPQVGGIEPSLPPNLGPNLGQLAEQLVPDGSKTKDAGVTVTLISLCPERLMRSSGFFAG
jgi:hypothetical protein